MLAPTASRCLPPWALASLLVLGCGGPTPIVVNTGSSGSTTHADTGPSVTTPGMPDTTAGIQTSDGSGMVDTTVGMSMGTSSSGPPPSTSTTSGTTSGTSSGTTSGTTSGSTDEGSSSGGGMPFVCPPGGGMACTMPGDCASNACYTVGPLGGICSECDEDADCAWGCHPGNPLSGDCAVCCDGSIGCGCESVVACQAGLHCTDIVVIPGIISQATCGECSIDADCPAGLLCAPSYDLAGLAGQHDCVAPGSRANNEGCNIAGSGDLQCASGNCATASLMGIPVVSVCSECNEDADCPGGSCVLPEVAIVGMSLDIIPGMCV